MRSTALLIMVVAVAAGCAAAPPDPATPTPSPAPQRPRELRLDGVDPCSLLTTQQRTTLGLDQESRPYVAVPPTPGPACSIVGFRPRAVGVGIVLAQTTGLASIVKPGSVSDQLTPTTVGGFPAVVARARNPDVCFVDVDIAQGQLVDILYRDGGGATRISQDELCHGAETVASEVVQTLSAG